jgi:hypothetical protein
LWHLRSVFEQPSAQFVDERLAVLRAYCQPLIGAGLLPKMRGQPAM